MTDHNEGAGAQHVADSAVHRMGRLVRDSGFAEGESLMVPGWQVWSSPVVEDLVPHLVDIVQEWANGYESRLARRLTGAAVETVQLAMELYYVHVLIPAPHRMGRVAKEKRLATVSAASPETVWFSDESLQALERGPIPPGPCYNLNRDQQLAWLARVLQQRSQYASEEWQRVVSDPWSFRAMVDTAASTDITVYQRNALLCLLFPETFQPVLSPSKQKEIINVFGDELTERSGDLHRDLLAVHTRLTERHGPFSFYDPEWRGYWDPTVSSKATGETGEQEGEHTPVAEPDNASLPASTGPGLSRPSMELAQRLCVEHAWLREVVESWERKKQVVFQGPPGTGKTYLARQLAQSVIGTNGACRFVQFHPSYAYEDFVEGFRPQPGASAGTVSFLLEPGPLKLLAQQAREDPSGTYVLLIDELNRANLPAVFGELYFLLEYRDQTVGLQYSPNEEFSLPSNLYVLATMNSADRSVAVVDAAMRRRFAWYTLSPEQPPVRGMLRRWLQACGFSEEPADLLETLNAQLPPGASPLGPSALMTDVVGTEEGLARIWHDEVLPQLSDRHPGEDIAMLRTRYGLEVLRRQPPLPAPPPVVEDPPVETGESR